MEKYIFSCTVLLFLYSALSFWLRMVASSENSNLNTFALERVPLSGTRDVNKIKPDTSKSFRSRWPMGIFNYYVDISSYDYIIAYRIRMAMNELETISCIKFSPLLIKPCVTNTSWIHITNPEKKRECVHEPISKTQNEIVVVLGYDCMSKADVLHSLLHAIGFKDEVTHPYRDRYIRVLWNNINPAYKHLYKIETHVDVDGSPLVEYDPKSIMNFNDHDFSANGQATIEPSMAGLVINPSDGLSPLDKLRLRLKFSHLCNKREVKVLLKTCKDTLKGGKKKKILSDKSIESNEVDSFDTDKARANTDDSKGTHDEDDESEENNDESDENDDESNDKNGESKNNESNENSDVESVHETEESVEIVKNKDKKRKTEKPYKDTKDKGTKDKNVTKKKDKYKKRGS